MIGFLKSFSVNRDGVLVSLREPRPATLLCSLGHRPHLLVTDHFYLQIHP
jgi:hypothetical protein